jgi:Family of unknown function (DUF6314)
VELVDTLAFLLGRWRISRTIDDHHGGTSGTFEGTAEVVRRQVTIAEGGEERARYDEVGTLRFGDHAGPARRRLVYVRRADATVMISFSDGRPFVDLDLRSGEWRTTHQCGADLHEITNAVVSADVMREHWRVRGPTTDYEATTTFVRTGLAGT